MVDIKKEIELTKEQRAARIGQMRAFIQSENRRLAWDKKQLEIMTRITEYEIKNSEIIDGKMKYLTDQDYISILNEMKSLHLETNTFKLKENIDRAQKGIKGAELDAKKLERNHKVPAVEEKEVNANADTQ